MYLNLEQSIIEITISQRYLIQLRLRLIVKTYHCRKGHDF